jgi:hypothetical protein
MKDQNIGGRYGDYYRMKAGAKLPERTRFTMKYPVFQQGEGVGESLKNIAQNAGVGMFELADAATHPYQTLEGIAASVIPQPLMDRDVRVIEKEAKDNPTAENKARLEHVRQLAQIPNPLKQVAEGMQQPGEFIPEMAGQAAMLHGLKLAPRLVEDFKAGPLSPEKRQAHLANAISETGSGSGTDPQTSAREVEPWLTRAAADNPSVRKVITDNPNPVESLKGQYAMNNLAETAIEKKYQGVVDRHPQLQSTPMTIDGVVELTADPILEEVLGKDTSGINEIFHSIDKPHTFSEWDNMRRKLGELAQKTYDSAPGSQSILNQVDALRRAADVVRNGLYDAVQEATGEDLRPLKSAQGKLIEHKWDLWKSIKRVGAEHQLETGPASSWKSWVSRWTEASTDKGGIGIPVAGHVFKRWKGTTAERVQGNLRNFYRDLPAQTPKSAPAPGGPTVGFSSRSNFPTPPGPGLPAGVPTPTPQQPGLPGASTSLAPTGMRGSVEQPVERGIGAPAPTAQIPGIGPKGYLEPPAPAPFSQTPPVNPGTAKMQIEPTNLEAAKSKVQAAQAAGTPAPRGFVVKDGVATPVPRGELPGKAPKIKARKGPAPRKADTVKPLDFTQPLTPGQATDAWQQPSSPRPGTQPKLPLAKPVSSVTGGKTTLHLPEGNEEMPATYRLMEASDLTTSHDPHSFAVNPKYPKGVQERAYDVSKEEQGKVIEQEQNFKPDLLVNTNPDAVNGPPVVMPDGTVMGGNSRSMTVARLYKSGKGDAYRDSLRQNAGTFGLKPEQINGMREPVLVRQVDAPMDTEAMRRFGSSLNKSRTGALGLEERAVSAGKSITPETIKWVSDLVQEREGTLREIMASKGTEILNRLVDDGVISSRERAGLIDSKTGGLNDAAKDFVENALMGRILDDPRLMKAAPKSILNKLESSIGSIASFSSRADEWNIAPVIRQAVGDYASAQVRGMTLDEFIAQQGLFRPQNPMLDVMRKAFGGDRKALREAFDKYARDSDANMPGQASMFGEASPADSFNAAFGTHLTEEEYRHGIEDGQDFDHR